VVESIAVKVVGGILALFLVIAAIPKLFGRRARLRRKLRAAQQRAIRDLAESVPATRRIAGMVVAIGEPLIAPLSGRPCVFYETRVERTVGLGVSSWDVELLVAFEKRNVPFVVDDGTGCALVDATHAEMLLAADVERSSSERGSDVAAEDAFLARFGQRRRGLLFEKRLYFTESVIEVGERVAVTRTVFAVHDMDAIARLETPTSQANAGTARYESDASGSPGAPYRHQAGTPHPRLSGADPTATHPRVAVRTPDHR